MMEPRTLDARYHPCRCCKRHVPAPRRTHVHHIIPLSYGGPDTPENEIPICPTGHDNIHDMLADWTKLGFQGARGNANDFLYELAERAWEHRPRVT